MFKATVIFAIALMLIGTNLDIIGFFCQNIFIKILILLVSGAFKVMAALCAVFALDISNKEK